MPTWCWIMLDLPTGDSEKDLSTDPLFLVVISGKRHRGREVKGAPNQGQRTTTGWQHPETLGSTFQTSLKLGHTQTTHVFLLWIIGRYWEHIWSIHCWWTSFSTMLQPFSKQDERPSAWDFLHHPMVFPLKFGVPAGVPANIGSHEETKFDLQQTDGIYTATVSQDPSHLGIGLLNSLLVQFFRTQTHILMLTINQSCSPISIMTPNRSCSQDIDRSW